MKDFIILVFVSVLLSACAVTTTSTPDPRYIQFKQALDNKLASIKSQENALKQKEIDLKNLSNQIAELKGQLRQIEARYPSAILPKDVYDQYGTIQGETNRLVDIYNDEVDHKYTPMYDGYSNLVDQYNAQVDEINKIAP